MTLCTHCGGRGRIPVKQPRPLPATRGAAAGKLPPFGREVEAAARTGFMPVGGVNIFHQPDSITGQDAWQLAEWSRQHLGPGSAMVLPAGDAPSAYRWPGLAARVVLWAHSMGREEAVALATALIESSAYSRIEVLGGQGGPVTVLADESPHE